jgi:hypothetical protein
VSLCLDDSYSWTIQTDEGRGQACISSLQETLVNSKQLDTCSVHFESYALEINQPTLLDIVIDLRDYSPLLPGNRVERMGRHGWSGRVLAVEVNSVLVEWWGRSQEWVDRTELYPLDSLGRPRIPNLLGNVQEIAKRARILLGQSSVKKLLDDCNNTQLPLF